MIITYFLCVPTGLLEEAQVGFHEHVFLDNLIVDFPKRGPIRHFMQLVTTGLSKNPYLTVQQKKEYINWFREYFEEKKELLDELIVSETTDTDQKHISEGEKTQ